MPYIMSSVTRLHNFHKHNTLAITSHKFEFAPYHKCRCPHINVDNATSPLHIIKVESFKLFFDCCAPMASLLSDCELASITTGDMVIEIPDLFATMLQHGRMLKSQHKRLKLRGYYSQLYLHVHQNQLNTLLFSCLTAFGYDFGKDPTGYTAWKAIQMSNMQRVERESITLDEKRSYIRLYQKLHRQNAYWYPMRVLCASDINETLESLLKMEHGITISAIMSLRRIALGLRFSNCANVMLEETINVPGSDLMCDESLCHVDEHTLDLRSQCIAEDTEALHSLFACDGGMILQYSNMCSVQDHLMARYVLRKRRHYDDMSCTIREIVLEPLNVEDFNVYCYKSIAPFDYCPRWSHELLYLTLKLKIGGGKFRLITGKDPETGGCLGATADICEPKYSWLEIGIFMQYFTIISNNLSSLLDNEVDSTITPSNSFRRNRVDSGSFWNETDFGDDFRTSVGGVIDLIWGSKAAILSSGTSASTDNRTSAGNVNYNLVVDYKCTSDMATFLNVECHNSIFNISKLHCVWDILAIVFASIYPSPFSYKEDTSIQEPTVDESTIDEKGALMLPPPSLYFYCRNQNMSMRIFLSNIDIIICSEYVKNMLDITCMVLKLSGDLFSDSGGLKEDFTCRAYDIDLAIGQCCYDTKSKRFYDGLRNSVHSNSWFENPVCSIDDLSLNHYSDVRDLSEPEFRNEELQEIMVNEWGAPKFRLAVSVDSSSKSNNALILRDVVMTIRVHIGNDVTIDSPKPYSYVHHDHNVLQFDIVDSFLLPAYKYRCFNHDSTMLIDGMSGDVDPVDIVIEIRLCDQKVEGKVLAVAEYTVANNRNNWSTVSLRSGDTVLYPKVEGVVR